VEDHSNNGDIIYQVRLISLISLGIFLYVLFFQPFEYKLEKFNDRLIFVLGIGVITFLILLLFRIILPRSLTSRIRSESLKISNEVGLILLIWFFIATANICYLFFVGGIDISLTEGVKIALFSAFPSIVLKIADVNQTLRNQLRSFVRRNVKLEKELASMGDRKQEIISFRSEAGSEKLELGLDNVMMIKSADNYVDIFYKEDDQVSHKLIRNTLKNIQKLLSDYHDFVRCHRSCIVNSTYILNMTNSYKGHRLIMLDMEEEIPVSRQYILAIKEALSEE